MTEYVYDLIAFSLRVNLTTGNRTYINCSPIKSENRNEHKSYWKTHKTSRSVKLKYKTSKSFLWKKKTNKQKFLQNKSWSNVRASLVKYVKI